jgi:ribulose-5-phosphate 4-epimerase/fuculose-1-phosphate aldolase
MTTTTTRSAPSPEVVALGRARVELAAAFRAAADFGFNEGIDNHFSLALPGRADRFLLNPFGPSWDELRASDLLVVDADGSIVEGTGWAEPTAFFIHSRVHLARPDARCVMHTHMPYATALTLTVEGFDPLLSQNSLRFLGHRMAVLPTYGGRALDSAEGDRIAAAVGDGARVVFLANHGIVVIGETVATALRDLYMLERACQVQVLAMSTGGTLRRVEADVAAMAAEQLDAERLQAPQFFDAVCRHLDRELPGYRV